MCEGRRGVRAIELILCSANPRQKIQDCSAYVYGCSSDHGPCALVPKRPSELGGAWALGMVFFVGSQLKMGDGGR